MIACLRLLSPGLLFKNYILDINRGMDVFVRKEKELESRK